MEQIKAVIQQMIKVSEDESNDFLNQAITKTFKRQEILSRPNVIPNEIFFINKGIIRVFITDNEGTEHTIHFALENQFIADYSNFIQHQPSIYSLQTLEETQVIILPRSAIKRWLTDPVFTTDVRNRFTLFLFAKDLHDLAFCEF
jgi:CRP-like cAMP-binding protein